MLKIDYNSIPRHTNEAANRRIVEVADSNFDISFISAMLMCALRVFQQAAWPP